MIANLVYNQRSLQDAVRESRGVELLLSQCQVSATGSPLKVLPAAHDYLSSLARACWLLVVFLALVYTAQSSSWRKSSEYWPWAVPGAGPVQRIRTCLFARNTFCAQPGSISAWCVSKFETIWQSLYLNVGWTHHVSPSSSITFCIHQNCRLYKDVHSSCMPLHPCLQSHLQPLIVQI